MGVLYLENYLKLFDTTVFHCGKMVLIMSDYHHPHDSQDSRVPMGGSSRQQAQEEAQTKEARARLQGRPASIVKETTFDTAAS